ncbi:HAD family phosphatase [Nocardioides marinus]|uniref:HAD superfamily hydrolase (TIGR01509 family) n=1 Tax=Nocardioides marinus TaxID=374514 RepID=A0A7Z0C3F8_9ACTN|nr:HAD family phosphatase [Nocardioides marinus]NYI10222.1 HAD superfamily hydrolase (TIGR01509 family) [Nocardioides marinus]
MTESRPSAAPAAVLWDMDGTLVDTEPYWIATEHAMADKYGGTWSQEQALSLVGNDLLSSGRVLKEAWGLPQSPAEVVEELLDGVVARVEESVPWQPGAPELLASLRDAGVPCALVTMSYERFVAPILRHLPAETFRVIVTGDQVERGKPHPEPYLTAAASLGLDPQDCVAIEDSNTGAKSAEAAGCAVLVVENHVPVLDGPRRVFRPTLQGLGPADVATVLAEVAARG